MSQSHPPSEKILDATGKTRQLVVNERRIELLVAAVTDYAIFMLDPEGVIETWNPGAQRNKGYTADEIIGQHFSVFYPPQDIASEKPARELKQALEAGRFEEEGWRIRKDGSQFWANIIITPVYDETHTLQGFATITRDFTVRRQVDLALRQSEERFRMLVQAVKDYAIFMLDPKGSVVSWNEGAERAKGYKASEIIGQNFSKFYTPEDRASGVPEELIARAGEQGRLEVEGWRVRKDGSRFWADVTLTAIRDEAGKLLGFSKVTRDVTEQRQAEETLRSKQAEINQLQKMEALGRLAGGIAHDFNNLLAGILGCSEAIKLAFTADNPAREDVEIIEKACDHGRQLVQQLMAFSRRQVAAPKVVQLNEIIQSVTPLLQRAMSASIDIHLELDPNLTTIKMDVSQLEQILMNIALNARDAMPANGRLIIRTANVWLDETSAVDGLPDRPCKAVELSIRDTGTGMSKDVLEKIFEPFYTTKSPGKGTGLGLSTVYGIIQQNKGGISVYSVPGMGTTFKIFLPVQGPGAGGPTSDSGISSEAPAAYGAELILVVEDDATVLRNTIRALQQKGYSVLSATNAEEAIESFRKARGKIRLLLTDIIMPGKNGKELADLLVADDPTLKVLFMSGYPAETIGDHGLIRGDVALLEKPFNSISLSNKVREVLDS
jgi:PAS domain S-box-containing protein